MLLTVAPHGLYNTLYYLYEQGQSAANPIWFFFGYIRILVDLEIPKMDTGISAQGVFRRISVAKMLGWCSNETFSPLSLGMH